MSTPMPATEAAKPARDFTYIKPSGRRLTEYEALSVHMQPDALDFDRPRGNLDVTEWYLLRPDGAALWRPESTRLRHGDWFAYRDPAQQWQRTYVRQQEQQETSIARITEDAGLDGSLTRLAPGWISEVLCRHYRAWSFFEYAIFRALAPAQREALGDTSATCCVSRVSIICATRRTSSCIWSNWKIMQQASTTVVARMPG